jgi:DDE family transposase
MLPLDALDGVIPLAELDRLAFSCGVNAVNQIKLPGQVVFLCLLNTLLNGPKVTQRLLEAAFERWLIEDVHYSAFSKRLAVMKPVYLKALFHAVQHRVQPLMRCGEERALRLRIVDATEVVLSAKLLSFGIHFRSGGNAGPGHNKRHVKSVLTLTEEGWPDFLHLCREQQAASDNVALGDAMVAATQPGDLWIVDGGLTDRDRMLAIHDAGGFFLVPHQQQKWRVLQTVWVAPTEGAEAQRSALLAAAQEQARRAGKRLSPPCRLLAVEQAVFENSDDAVRPSRQEQWARMPLLVFRCERYDVRTGTWKPLVLLTNLPLSAEGKQAGPYRLEEIPELYRRRWEIELFFKFVKQHLSYAHLTSRCANGIELMIWVALIAALLMIWYQRRTGNDRGWRVVKYWLSENAREWLGAALQQALQAQRGAAPG